MAQEPKSPEEQIEDPPTRKNQDPEEAFDVEEEAGEPDWEEPGSDLDEDAAGSEAVVGAAAEAFSEKLLRAHAQLEESLAQVTLAASEAGAMAEDAFDGAGNIVGVGLGFGEDAPMLGEPGAGCLNVYVVEPCSQDAARATLVDSMGVAEASSEDLPVNVIVTGIIDAQPHRFKIRPAPGGVSCGR